MMPGEPRSLVSGDFLKSLRRLDLASRKIVRGGMAGEHRSKKRGVSVEFTDFKQYSPGDDLRFIDWNAYARLDRVFIKLFIEERDRVVHLLVDTSKSMDFGEPRKHFYARQAAAALAYIALLRGDRVGVCAISTELDDRFPLSRGAQNMGRLLSFLEGLVAGGHTALSAACRQFAQASTRRSLVILISDFLDPAGVDGALGDLGAARCDVAALHVLAPREVAPELGGNLRLVDSETGSAVDISLSAPLLNAYQRRLKKHQDDLRALCMRRGVQYASVTTDVPIQDLVMHTLRRAGIVS